MPDRRDDLREALREHFGHEDFRGDQRAIVERIMGGQSCLAIKPTGGGKSLTYQLPAVLMDGVAVVISPLIALMHDQMRAAAAHGLRAATLTSADEDQARTIARLQAGALDLLYVAPERAAREDFASLLAGVRVAFFAVDEAHCVSEWGHDFRPDYRGLMPLFAAHAVPRLALTATADAHTRADIMGHFGIPDDGLIVSGFDRPNIHYAMARRGDTVVQLKALLSQQPGAGIIYCPTRAQVEKISDALASTGRYVLPYHAGRWAAQRAANQKAFFARPGAVMVATIAFGMGVDKGDVRFIAHTAPPRSIEAYYQETGRAGRDGLPATALMLWTAKDLAKAKARLAGVAPERLEAETHRHAAMARLIGTWGCRRAALLRYFGDPARLTCGNCDHCARTRWAVAGVEAMRRIGRMLTRG
jgi:ATP-dependent DNA helicase RecQ